MGVSQIIVEGVCKNSTVRMPMWGGVQIGGGRVFGVSHCGGGNRKGGILA